MKAVNIIQGIRENALPCSLLRKPVFHLPLACRKPVHYFELSSPQPNLKKKKNARGNKDCGFVDCGVFQMLKYLCKK